MDAAERELVAMVAPGVPYVDIHVAAHRHVAAMLTETGILKGDPDELLALGLTRPFLPHGVGHQLGLQVHDVGGRQAGPDGGTVPPPEEHPFLRNTRVIEPGHVVTIEPGLYFVPMLLDPVREGEHKDHVDWEIVDRLTPLGGIRIEDDVLCTEDGFDDFTRHLCPGPRGS
jgi:Xaa-Pro dipeptidase